VRHGSRGTARAVGNTQPGDQARRFFAPDSSLTADRSLLVVALLAFQVILVLGVLIVVFARTNYDGHLVQLFFQGFIFLFQSRTCSRMSFSSARSSAAVLRAHGRSIPPRIGYLDVASLRVVLQAFVCNSIGSLRITTTSRVKRTT